MIDYSAAQLAVAQQIFDFFSPADKLGPMGAVAAAVNAFCKSSFKPDIEGDHDKAFGLWQEHADCDVTNLVLKDDADVAAQCAFIWRDMQTTERHARDAILAAKTSADATYAWCARYERPAAAETEAARRAGLAAEWAAHFGVAS